MMRLVVLFAVLVCCSACTRQPTKKVATPNKADEAKRTAVDTNSQEPKQAKQNPVPHSNEHFSATTIDQTNRPLGLPEYHVLAGNPMTEEKVELGRKLFFDKTLSVDYSMSCGTCHDPEKGWADGQKFATGVNGAVGRRNVPSILNAAYYRTLFWDGRAGSLEEQALGPIYNKDEMGMPSAEELLTRLGEHEEYPMLFAKAFQTGITKNNVVRAIASYERTIIAGNSPYDRYVAGDKDAMSESAVRGMELFMDEKKSKCSICHEPPAFTALFYHNLGVGYGEENPDLGRYEVLKMDAQIGRFKVPTVRDVKDTAPYMHDGSIATLEETIEFYDKGGNPNPHLSKEMRGKLNLTKQQKADLLAFMVEGLTSDDQPTP